MSWVFFALLTPILYSVTYLIDRDLMDTRVKHPLSLMVVTGLFGVFPLIGFAMAGGLTPMPWPLTLMAIVAGIAGIFAYLPYFHALTYAGTANVVLMWSLTPVFAALSTWLFLGEVLTANQYLALLFLVVGSAIASWQPGGGIASSRALGLMLLSSLFIATETTLLEAMFMQASYTQVMAWVVLTVVVLCVAIALGHSAVRTRFASRSFWKQGPWFALNELFDTSAGLVKAFAISLGPTSLVQAIAGVESVFVLILAYVVSQRLKHLVSPGSIPLVLLATALVIIGFALL